MRHLLATLILASACSVYAGLFQRQCYPETVLVTVTATADPVVSTTTCTETVLSTKTVTAHVHASTVTALVTSTLTVQPSNITVTETLEGGVFPNTTSVQFASTVFAGSSSTDHCKNHNDCPPVIHILTSVQASSVDGLSQTGSFGCRNWHDCPPVPPTFTAFGGASTISLSQADISPCKNLHDCASTFASGLPTVSIQTTVSATTTVHAVSTVTVMPMATMPRSYSVASAETLTASSGSSESRAVHGPASTPMSASVMTTTVDVTETIYLTSFASLMNATSSSLILNVTSTTGFGLNGWNSSTSMTSMASTGGIVHGPVFGTPSATQDAQRTASGNATLTAISTPEITTSLLSANASLTTNEPVDVTSLPSIANTSLTAASVLGNSSTTGIGVAPSQSFNVSSAASTTAYNGSQAPPTVTTMPASSRFASFSNATFTGDVSMLASASSGQEDGSTQSMTPANASNASNTVTAASTATSQTDVGNFTQAGAIPATMTSINSSSLQTTVPLSDAVSPSQTVDRPVPFLNSTQVQPSSLDTVTSTASAAPFTNSTSQLSTTAASMISSSLPSATAPLSRRCARDGSQPWIKELKRELRPVTMTLKGGVVVTVPWDEVFAPHQNTKIKRQVGQVIAATIDGHAVTWVNNWDGSGTVDLSTVVPTISPQAATSAASQVTSSVSDADPSQISMSSPVTVSKTISPSIISTHIQSSSGTSPPTPSSSVFASAATTISLSRSTLTSSVSADRAGDGSSSRQLPTDQFPSFHPPSWLTSMFPVAPTEVGSGSVATGTTSDADTSKVPTCSGINVGEFVVDFEDLPQDGQPATTDQFPAFKNPYHKLLWSQGFSYAPPPNDPYLPRSGEQLGVFVVDGTANIHSVNWTGPIPQGSEVNGMFGAGPNYQNPSFYIDAFGAWLGCHNTGPDYCDIQVHGYGFDDVTGMSTLQVEQHFYQAPCPELQDCALDYFQFDKTFHNLTALQIQASHQNDTEHIGITWYVDDIALAWTDNSCAAVKARDSLH